MRGVAKPIGVLALLGCLGCTYRAPFMPGLDAGELQKAKACEVCARSQKDDWHGIWDARIHSLHT
jgi:hypothetical protein